MMECERWLQARINDLRRRSALDQNTNVTHLPEKLQRNFAVFNSNEMNVRGESLILSVVKYEPDKVNQVRHISMLVRAGCDPSTPDIRQLRTPLMVACLKNNEAVALHLISLNCNLVACDHLGNNALMYATMYCQAIVVKRLMAQLAVFWGFDAYVKKNCSGQTAEAIAKKNDRILFAKMLRRERKRLASRLRIFVEDHIDYSSHYRSWNLYFYIYIAYRKFRSFKKSLPSMGYCINPKSEYSIDKVEFRNESRSHFSRQASVDQIYQKNKATACIEKEAHSTTLPKIAMSTSHNKKTKMHGRSTSQIREALSM